VEDLPPLGRPPLAVPPPSPEESFTDAWDLDGADLALDNLLSPEIIEEVRLEPTWEVDIISFPAPSATIRVPGQGCWSCRPAAS